MTPLRLLLNPSSYDGCRKHFRRHEFAVIRRLSTLRNPRQLLFITDTGRSEICVGVRLSVMVSGYL